MSAKGRLTPQQRRERKARRAQLERRARRAAARVASTSTGETASEAGGADRPPAPPAVSPVTSRPAAETAGPGEGSSSSGRAAAVSAAPSRRERDARLGRWRNVGAFLTNVRQRYGLLRPAVYRVAEIEPNAPAVQLLEYPGGLTALWERIQEREARE